MSGRSPVHDAELQSRQRSLGENEWRREIAQLVLTRAPNRVTQVSVFYGVDVAAWSCDHRADAEAEGSCAVPVDAIPVPIVGPSVSIDASLRKSQRDEAAGAAPQA